MRGNNAVRVLIVDDHVLLSQGLKNLLSQEQDFDVVGQAGRVQEAVELTLSLKPDLVLLDLSLADGSGFDVLKAVIAQRPQTAVVILTGHNFEHYMFEAIRMGARGYIQKETSITGLVAALRGIQEGQAAVSREMASRLVEEVQRLGGYVDEEPSGLATLTARERQVLALLGSGASTPEIADQLVISSNTVKVHVHNLLEKLNLKNRAQATRFAQRYGFYKRYGFDKRLPPLSRPIINGSSIPPDNDG